MTMNEYLKKQPDLTCANLANYKSLVRLCICFDVDYLTESYEECIEKVNASIAMLSDEMDTMSDCVEAQKLFQTRTAKLPKVR